MLSRITYQEARGLRNRNPGNIRYNPANDWRGQVGRDPEGFVIFDTPENGIRAMGKTLDSYSRQGVKTLVEIISRWAPGTENDTGSYIQDVATEAGWDPGYEPVRSDFPVLVAAMIKHENGFNPFNNEFISDSLEVA